MSRPDPAEQSRSRRERILDAAFHAFATRGYRDTAVDDIAGAAETSKGGIYFHFPTKEAIFRELTWDRRHIFQSAGLFDQIPWKAW